MTTLLILFGVGFCAQFLGTLAGSGGLITFPAMILLGVPVHATISANKLSNVITSSTSLLTLLKRKSLSLSEVLRDVPIGLVAGVIGGLITASIPNNVMKVIAILLLVLVFILSFIKPKKKAEEGGDTGGQTKGLKWTFFGIGIYNGAFGPGQGSILMHSLTRRGIQYLKAIGLTRANTLASGLGAVITYILSGYMVWGIAIAITAGGIIGGQCALLVAPKMSKKMIKGLMRVAVLLMVLQLIIENLIRSVLS